MNFAVDNGKPRFRLSIGGTAARGHVGPRSAVALDAAPARSLRKPATASARLRENLQRRPAPRTASGTFLVVARARTRRTPCTTRRMRLAPDEEAAGWSAATGMGGRLGSRIWDPFPACPAASDSQSVHEGTDVDQPRSGSLSRSFLQVSRRSATARRGSCPTKAARLARSRDGSTLTQRPCALAVHRVKSQAWSPPWPVPSQRPRISPVRYTRARPRAGRTRP